jgi:CheY-like chemotaxis protein
VIRVVLADDAADLRFLVRLTLETDGRFQVVGDAADGVEAIALVESESPDVVVLDMAMPRMDGLEVLAALKARGFNCKVLAMSGFNGGVEERATALGAHDYLRKGTAPLTDLVPRLLALCAA